MSQFKILNHWGVSQFDWKSISLYLKLVRTNVMKGVCVWVGRGGPLILLLELNLIEIGLWSAPKFNLIYLLLIYLFVCLFVWHRLDRDRGFKKRKLFEWPYYYFFQISHKYIIMCAIFLITVNIQCIWYK